MRRRGFLVKTAGVLGAASVRNAMAEPSPGLGAPAEAMPAADGEASWSSVRQRFPLTRERIYLNTAGLGPSPQAVIDAVHRKTMELEEISETGHTEEVWRGIKERGARLFGCDAEELAFTRNTTEGVNIVCNGLPLGAGDEVITSTHEHVGNTISWIARARRDGIRMRVFEPAVQSAAETVDRIARLITPRTRAISISHVTTTTGQVLPVREIGRLAARHGLWYFIDGAQSAGQLVLDVRGIGCHAYATSGHKWLLGPKGTGLLYVARDALDAIQARWVGAWSNEGAFDMATGEFAFHPSAQRYEYGTMSTPLFHGLGAAMDFLLDLGMERVWQRDQDLGRRLIAGLREAGAEVLSPLQPGEHSAIVTFRLEGMPRPELQQRLAREHQIRSRGIYEGGLEAVRVSPHVFSLAADVDRVVEAVRQLRG